MIEQLNKFYTATAERPQAREQILGSPEFVGLQARLLVTGEYLNPNKNDFPNIEAQTLGTFQQRDYSIYQIASISERREFWQNQENNDFERQRQAWIRDTQNLFQNSRNFFENSNKGRNFTQTFSQFGINAAAINQQQIESFYNSFLANNNPDQSIKKFVADILEKYREGQRIDTNRLQNDKEAISWLSNVFGTNSREVIWNLIEAEINLQTSQQELIRQANEGQRVNNLNDSEKRILNFLWQYAWQPVPAPPPPTVSRPEPVTESIQPITDKYTIVHERAKDPREFIDEKDLEFLLDPRYVAMKLQAENPQYEHVPYDNLVQAIEGQQQVFNKWMQHKGLTGEYLEQVLLENLKHYESFITRAYNITLPELKNVTVMPIFGHTSRLYNPSGDAFAFVSTKYPAIFIDFEAVAKFANGLGLQDWQTASREQIREDMIRVLREVHPHEYTHLVADLAFWDLYRGSLPKNPDGTYDTENAQRVERMGARFGLALLKPVSMTESEHLIPIERGRGLMEAVTVELTNQWAKSIDARLDIDAYAAERVVLSELSTLLSREQNITQEEAFKKFAQVYFIKDAFRTLVEELSGKQKDGNGKITFKRPHFMQIILASMEFESRLSAQDPRLATYPLTRAIIRNIDNLNGLPNEYKTLLTNLINVSENEHSVIQLSERARRYLAKQLGS